ncbi:hypothetical protein ABC255_26745 [Neobacillus sp. 3P2-tot-E-2]|uniref:hypothetical protein n=1 Tax=Neobacillus sp. 3P2-tot-E-2 TaxID=3132212 RepID=UPI0039A38E78
MNLNFKDKDSIREFLKRDKHKLLEGMVVEELFMEDIASPKNWNPWMSKGWWSIRNPFNFGQYILFHVSSYFPLTADIEIYKLLSQKNIQCYHVLLVNNDLYFLDLLPYNLDTQIDKSNYISKSEFLEKYGSNSQDRDILLAEESTRNIFNQERAISFFESQNLLEEVALQRYFANYFLTVCLDTYPVNLDAFIIFDDGPAVLEIKFKYPDSGGHYGINKGQAALFRWLMNLGFNVYHYIADNPTGDKKYGIFDVINSAKVSNIFYWKYKQLTSSELLTNHVTAPKETNISGKKPVDYIPISANSFINTQIIVGQHIDTTNIARESCTRIGCSGFREIAKWNNGYFWGCTNFKNHKSL